MGHLEEFLESRSFLGLRIYGEYTCNARLRQCSEQPVLRKPTLHCVVACACFVWIAVDLCFPVQGALHSPDTSKAEPIWRPRQVSILFQPM
jgi:hypothetical protein